MTVRRFLPPQVADLIVASEFSPSASVVMSNFSLKRNYRIQNKPTH